MIHSDATPPTGDDGTVSADFVRLDAALSGVRALHSERVFNGDGYGWTVCAECRQAWPCATEQAIAVALAIIETSEGEQRGEL